MKKLGPGRARGAFTIQYSLNSVKVSDSPFLHHLTTFLQPDSNFGPSARSGINNPLWYTASNASEIMPEIPSLYMDSNASDCSSSPRSNSDDSILVDKDTKNLESATPLVVSPPSHISTQESQQILPINSNNLELKSRINQLKSPTLIGKVLTPGTPFAQSYGKEVLGHRAKLSTNSIGYERLLNILSSTKDEKVNAKSISKGIDASLKELDSIQKQSKVQVDTLSDLQSKLAQVVDNTKSVKDKMFVIVKALDTQREAQLSVISVANLLVDQNRELMRRITHQDIDGEVVYSSSDSIDSTIVGTNSSKTEHIILDHLSAFSHSLQTQNENTNNVLAGFKSYFDRSILELDHLYQNITGLVHKEIADASKEFSMSIKYSTERTHEQLQILGSDLLQLQTTLTEQFSNKSFAYSNSYNNDHYQTEIIEKLAAFEEFSKEESDKKFNSLVEFISLQLEEYALLNETQTNQVKKVLDDVHAKIDFDDEKASATKDLILKLNDMSLSIDKKFEKDLKISQNKALQAEIALKEQENSSMQRIQELESKLKQNEIEYKDRIRNLEEQLLNSQMEKLEADNKRKLMAAEMRLLKYFNNDIERHEQIIQDLESTTEELRNEKSLMEKNLGEMNVMYQIRMEEYEKLETRVSTFESRLNNAILDRSRSILGSTTLSIIKSESPIANVEITTSETHLKAAAKSNNSRHFSLSPVDLEQDKENGALIIGKRGLDHESPGKQRSISLFVDHDK